MFCIVLLIQGLLQEFFHGGGASFFYNPLKTTDFTGPVTEFKEFERRFKFKPRFKYGWFHLKLYQIFQDLNRR